MNLRRAAVFFSFLSSGIGVSASASAHISLNQPPSRYHSMARMEADQQKQKQGPCGATGDKRTTNSALVTTFKPGQKVEVRWTETIQHPGHFRLAFDTDGQDFTVPGSATPGDGVTILADKISDTSSRDYKQEITLPNIECSNCTLQLIQVMTTSSTFKDGDFYFNCADVILKSDGSSGGAGGAGGGSGGVGFGGSGSGGMGTSAGNSGGTAGGLPSMGVAGSNSAGGQGGLGQAGQAHAGQAHAGQTAGGSFPFGGSGGSSGSGAVSGGTNSGFGGTLSAASASSVGGSSAGGSSIAGTPAGGSPASGGINPTAGAGLDPSPNGPVDGSCTCRLGASGGADGPVLPGSALILGLLLRRRKRGSGR